MVLNVKSWNIRSEQLNLQNTASTSYPNTIIYSTSIFVNNMCLLGIYLQSLFIPLYLDSQERDKTSQNMFILATCWASCPKARTSSFCKSCVYIVMFRGQLNPAFKCRVSCCVEDTFVALGCFCISFQYSFLINLVIVSLTKAYVNLNKCFSFPSDDEFYYNYLYILTLFSCMLLLKRTSSLVNLDCLQSLV